MASSSDNISMAVFCDFENVALGVRDANYEKFDIKPILERLLLKGSIVVKKSYCDWERYKGFKAGMHEANFELIEIPHVRQSGKNSADIRLVVDALDLCYTKSHVNTFVIISGDSDFSPLVSKLRENAKQVIGVGVKQSTSDLLVANCDEFIFYDDLVREQRRAAAKRDERKAQPQAKRSSDDRRKEELEMRKVQALEMVAETFDALASERGESGKIWASLLKDTLKRRRPDFSETYYGFRTFGNLLEEAQTRGLFEFGRDEKSGAYVYRSSAAPAPVQHVIEQAAPVLAQATQQEVAEAALAPEAQPEPKAESRRRGRGGRKQSGRDQEQQEMAARAEEAVAAQLALAGPVGAPRAEVQEAPAQERLAEAEGLSERIEAKAEAEAAAGVAAPAAKERRRAPRKPAARKSAAATEAQAETPAAAEPSAAGKAVAEPEATAESTGEAAGDAEAKSGRKKAARPAHKASARNSAPRSRRPAKPKTGAENG
jgi:uncharacterized LabA/DUF88 family protein